jgi:hypothetical protein
MTMSVSAGLFSSKKPPEAAGPIYKIIHRGRKDRPTRERNNLCDHVGKKLKNRIIHWFIGIYQKKHLPRP